MLALVAISAAKTRIGGQSFDVRITHLPFRRSVIALSTEIKWLSYIGQLYGLGLKVCSNLRIPSINLVIRIICYSLIILHYYNIAMVLITF